MGLRMVRLWTGVFVATALGAAACSPSTKTPPPPPPPDAGPTLPPLSVGALVASRGSDQVLRYDGSGAAQGVFASDPALVSPIGINFGPDGNTYVASFFDDAVVRFNRRTGQSMGTFASKCDGPEMIEFGPNGDLYVASYFGDSVDRFDGRSGTLKLSIFGGGLAGPMDIAFREIADEDLL